jgi:hypothetical protein
MRDFVRKYIERLRETLPPLLKIKQYCHVRNRSQASAYNDLHRIPGLGVKDGRSTRIVRDVMLDDMARMPEWIPEKDRLQNPSPLVGQKVNSPSRSGKLAASRRPRRKRADQNQEAGAAPTGPRQTSGP